MQLAQQVQQMLKIRAVKKALQGEHCSTGGGVSTDCSDSELAHSLGWSSADEVQAVRQQGMAAQRRLHLANVGLVLKAAGQQYPRDAAQLDDLIAVRNTVTGYRLCRQQ